MIRIFLPRSNWHMALAKAIKEASKGVTIMVHTEEMKALAELAAQRMERTDLLFELEESEEA